MSLRTACRRRAVWFAVAGVLVPVASSLVVAPLQATDPPHWTGGKVTVTCGSSTASGAYGCHDLHNGPGILYNAAGNSNLCQACHNATGDAKDLPVDQNKANLATKTGYHHAWDAAAVNATLETRSPLNAELATRLNGTQVICSTCHNQHASDSTKGGLSRIGAVKETKNPLSTGTVTLAAGLDRFGTFTGAAGFWYVVTIATAGTPTTATFNWSKIGDNGGVVAGASGVTAGTARPLDNGISVAFSDPGTGGFRVGDRYEFSAAWPFLRVPLDSGPNSGAGSVLFCRDCHNAWAQTSADIEAGNGIAMKSHPVGAPLAAAAALDPENYRTVPLDANGTTTTDGNLHNDLRLDAGGFVQCATCHRAHYAPSVSSAQSR